MTPKNPPNFSILMVKSLRGKRTAAQMSRYLGYSSNQVNRWESGHSLITWDALVDYSRKRSIEVEKNLYAAFSFRGKPESAKDIILFFFGNRPQKDIAHALQVSPAAVTNWMKDKVSPSAECILHIIEQSNFSFSDFLSCFVPKELQIQELQNELLKEELEKKNIHAYPWLIAVLSLIDTPEFAKCKNLEEKLAHTIGIDPVLCNKILEALKKENILKKDSETNEHVLNVSRKTLNIAADRELLVKSIKFWNAFALSEAVNADANVKNQNRAAFITFSVAEENIPKLHEIFLNTFHQINSLANGKKGEKVFTLTSLLADVCNTTLGKMIGSS